MIQWCKCRTTIGYASLNDTLNTFVCVQCWWPTYLVYDKSHKLCEECGASFYSPWEEICKQCWFELQALAYEIDPTGESEDAKELLDRCSENWKDWDYWRGIVLLLETVGEGPKRAAHV